MDLFKKIKNNNNNEKATTNQTKKTVYTISKVLTYFIRVWFDLHITVWRE